MAFHLRSLSARRYRVEGDLPPVHDPKFAKRLLERRFKPLSAHEERAVGWVTADNCLDTELTEASIARGPAAVFSMRIDRRRVNGRVLRAMMDLEMRGRVKDAPESAQGEGAGGKAVGGKAVGGQAVGGQAAGGKAVGGKAVGGKAVGGKAVGGQAARRRVGREERAEIRRGLTEELLRNTSPAMEVHPVVFFPREKLVLFLALSRPANEAFRALFADTFEVGLSALTPFHRAVELLEGRGAAEALAGVSRTEFGRAGDAGRGAGEPAVRQIALPSQKAIAVEEIRR